MNDMPQPIEQPAAPNTAFKSFDVSKKFKEKPKIIYIVLGVVVALIIAGVTLYLAGGPKSILKPLSNGIGVDTGGTEEDVISVLTGERFPPKKAKDWKDIRPLAVMVNNYIDARPQSGLTEADLVYEIVAEGGITRFLAFFNTAIPEKIGPVRSTRDYYLVLVKELGDAMIMHIGWSPRALTAIETWPVRSLGRGGGSFWRDDSLNVATEHTAYVNGKELVKRGLELGWEGTREFDVWKFKEEAKYANAVDATRLSIDFWYKGDYSAVWEYDADKNVYKRFMGYDSKDAPVPHEDRETKEQIAVKNVIVQFADESKIIGDDKNRLEYKLIGSGEGLVFLDGKVVPVTWSKEERDTRTKFYDINGNEMEFNRGKFWISIVPSRNVDQVVYE